MVRDASVSSSSFPTLSIDYNVLMRGCMTAISMQNANAKVYDDVLA